MKHKPADQTEPKRRAEECTAQAPSATPSHQLQVPHHTSPWHDPANHSKVTKAAALQGHKECTSKSIHILR
ncbi:hypothetical protein E2C01_013030 [Portunus trituberculatus]|uniref:Uncharacterized protein n=1 Tax=Portunus trituberculatus TaxID=210409 RepID=A0A5B7DG01_PORTR|nr:hypothetical protein [Portunus trituberculatus]